MYKRIISLILTLIMLITIVPSTIVAASEVRTMEGVEASGKQSECNRPEVDKSEENIIYMVNPLYEDVISIDDLKKSLTPQTMCSYLRHPRDSIFQIMTVPFHISESRWLAERRK